MLIAQAIPAVQIATRVAKLKNHNQTQTFNNSVHFEQKNSVYKRIRTSCKYSYIIPEEQGQQQVGKPPKVIPYIITISVIDTFTLTGNAIEK